MRPTMNQSCTCTLARETTSNSAGMPMSSNAAGWLAMRMKRVGRRFLFFWCRRRSTSSARTKQRDHALNRRATGCEAGCLPGQGSHESTQMSAVKATKSSQPIALRMKRNSGSIHQLPSRKVGDAPEACDEACFARHDPPEREVRQLEVDRLLREAVQPRALQVLERTSLIGKLQRLPSYGDPHEGKGIGAAVVGLGDGQRTSRIAREVLRVPGEPADVDMKGGEILLRE